MNNCCIVKMEIHFLNMFVYFFEFLLYYEFVDNIAEDPKLIKTCSGTKGFK